MIIGKNLEWTFLYQCFTVCRCQGTITTLNFVLWCKYFRFMFIQPWYKGTGWNIQYLSGSLSISWLRLWSVKTLQPPGPALGILNGWPDDAGYDVTSYRPGWVLGGPPGATASTMRAFNNSFEAFFCDHSPPAFISPRRRDQSLQPGEAPALCSTQMQIAKQILSQNYHPSPRHYGCQGYRGAIGNIYLIR